MNRRFFVNDDRLWVVCAYIPRLELSHYTYVHDSVFPLVQERWETEKDGHILYTCYTHLHILFIITNVKCRRLWGAQRLLRLKRRPEIRFKNVAKTCRCQTIHLFSSLCPLLLLFLLLFINISNSYCNIRYGSIFRSSLQWIVIMMDDRENKIGHAWWKRQNKAWGQFWWNVNKNVVNILLGFPSFDIMMTLLYLSKT